MNPADVLLFLVEAGLVLWVQGDEGNGLRFRGPAGALTPELRDAAKTCRAALVALVRSGAVLPDAIRDWPAAAREDFEERSGIGEFEGGLARDVAERQAESAVRLEHTRAFVRRNALMSNVLPPDVGAVAGNRPSGGPSWGP